MRVTIVGGDRRSLIAGERLAADGYECIAFGFEKRPDNYGKIHFSDNISDALKNSQAVILPLPCEKNGFLNMPFSDIKLKAESIFSLTDEKTLFMGGKMPKTGENIVDYSEREEFCLKNAVPTAEGAIALAMSELPITLHSAKALVIGFGRIGNYLSVALKGLGADVTTAARSLKSRALAETAGIKAVGFDEFEASLSQADIIFNTVPFKIIGQRQLEAIRPETPIIDLASLPGGADEAECRAHDRILLRALSLPGKVAPVTAGDILYETVKSILSERGIVQ